MKVEILDLGINNISSIQKSLIDALAFEDQLFVINDGNQSDSPDLIILPGLGHFEKGIQNLQKRKFDTLLSVHALAGKKIAGICLGMQLLCNGSEEADHVPGLGLINAKVKKLPPIDRIPNIGWDMVEILNHTGIFPTLGWNKDFYFAHSYYVEPEIPDIILTTTQFAKINFASSYLNAGILGVQFHPEKSGRVGQEFMKELIQWAKH